MRKKRDYEETVVGIDVGLPPRVNVITGLQLLTVNHTGKHSHIPFSQSNPEEMLGTQSSQIVPVPTSSTLASKLLFSNITLHNKILNIFSNFFLYFFNYNI